MPYLNLYLPSCGRPLSTNLTYIWLQQPFFLSPPTLLFAIDIIHKNFDVASECLNITQSARDVTEGKYFQEHLPIHPSAKILHAKCHFEMFVTKSRINDIQDI